MSAGAALATPSSGITGSTLGRGTLDGKVKMRSEGPSDVLIRQITVDPGGYTGWHTHPGPAIVVVTSGALTLYDGDDKDCTGKTYGPGQAAGQAFVDPGYGHVHIARNVSGTTPAQFVVTFLDVPVGGAASLDAADLGNCSF